MERYLVDTSVIIDYLREDKKAVSFLNSLEKPTISIVTASEVYQGAKNKKDLKEIKRFLKFLGILPVNEAISQFSLELLEKYSLSSGLLILDSFIAATAIKNNLSLVTANVKHFKMIKGLKIKKWE